MLKEFKCYTLICDNCGIDLNENSEVSCWTDKLVNYDIAEDSNWITEEDKYYCPDCYKYYDDESYKIIIDVSRKNKYKE